MTTFLIGLSWCDPEEVAACKRVGLDDDPRCSTGIFIYADTGEEALSWGKTLADKYMESLFREQNYAPDAMEVFCWIEANPGESSEHGLGESWVARLEDAKRRHVGSAGVVHDKLRE